MTVGPLLIKQVVPPADLVSSYMKIDSGNVDPSLLVNVGPSGNLHHDAARAYKALAFMCMAIGLPLTYTYGGTYRNYQSQVYLFLQRYSTTYIAGASSKVWQGKTYWLKPGNAMAAVPGKSNHGWGLAIDFAFDSDLRDGIGPDDAIAITGHPQWQTFKLYAVDCGFSWEDTSEPWHLRLVTGSTPTQTVLNAEAVMYPKPVPPTPVPTPVPVLQPQEEEEEEEDMFVFIAKKDGAQYLWMPGKGAPIPLHSIADRDALFAQLGLANADGSPKPGSTVSDEQFNDLR